jgi:tetratricopeptide (TPR) repeat protein
MARGVDPRSLRVNRWSCPMRPTLALLVLVVLVAPLSACSEPLRDEPLEPLAESPKPAMTGLVGAVTTLLPLTLRDGAFADPAHAAAITNSLGSLADHTTQLQEYAWGQDEGFKWLARSLEQDVEEARAAYARRAYEEASFRVQRLTANCVTCHSRLPSQTDSGLGAQLIKSIDTRTLHPDELAQLQLATRQFDAAAGTYEELLGAAPKAGDVGRLWYFVDYLVVCIRVLGDRARPLPILTRYATSEGLPSFMRRDLQGWLAALQDLQSPAPVTDTAAAMTQSRALIEQAQALEKAAPGQQGLVQWIVASSLLHGVVSARRDPSPQLAEAWYLLGLAEARIGFSPWLSQPEYYLETAVRTAPGSTFAKDALAHLEWHVAVQYTGSGGEQIPADVQAQLNELHALVETASAPR